MLRVRRLVEFVDDLMRIPYVFKAKFAGAWEGLPQMSNHLYFFLPSRAKIYPSLFTI